MNAIALVVTLLLSAERPAIEGTDIVRPYPEGWRRSDVTWGYWDDQVVREAVPVGEDNSACVEGNHYVILRSSDEPEAAIKRTKVKRVLRWYDKPLWKLSKAELADCDWEENKDGR